MTQDNRAVGTLAIPRSLRRAFLAAVGFTACAVNLAVASAGTGSGNCLQNGTGRQSFAFPAPGSGFDGWVNATTVAVGGVYSNILNYDPYIDPTSGDVSAWSMVADAANYAQIGWVKTTALPAGTPPVVFIEVSEPTNFVQVYRTDLPVPIGTAQFYTTLYDPTNIVPCAATATGKFAFQYNGSPVGSQVCATFKPTQGQNLGETHNNADQMPGGSSNPDTFTSTNIWTPAGSGGSWQAFNGQAANDDPVATNSPYHNHMTSSTGIQIWDGACQ